MFPWSVVRGHRDAVTALMASDNFANGFGHADSELRCIVKVYDAIVAPLPIPNGMSQWDVVSQQILRLAGQRWSLEDLGHFLIWFEFVTNLQIIYLMVITILFRKFIKTLNFI